MTSSFREWSLTHVQRYRTTLLVTTAALAVCAIYYLREADDELSKFSSSRKRGNLQRSNAQRRRTRHVENPVILDTSTPSLGPLPNLDFLDEVDESPEACYGIHIVQNNAGTLTFELNFRLRSQLDSYIASREIDEVSGEPILEGAIIAMLALFLGSHLGRHCPTERQKDDIVARLGNLDLFTSEAVRDMLQKHESGTLTATVAQWLLQQQDPSSPVDSRQITCDYNPWVTPTSISHTLPNDDTASTDFILSHATRDEHEHSPARSVLDADINEGRAAPRGDGKDLLDLLYRNAEDQARKEGYVHRGISCDSCSACPIKGIRYKCSNCADYDLCEMCEAIGVHYKTHLFYKVRIPRPHLHQQPQKVYYAGTIDESPHNLERDKIKHFTSITGFKDSEIEGIWDQFRCMAASQWPDDPDGVDMAIDRFGFQHLIDPVEHEYSSAPNLVYDRVFAFYDTDNNGLIGFGEFITGLSQLKKRGRKARWKCVFAGFDIDGDGYISRKDVLRIFRAHFELLKGIIGGLVKSRDGVADHWREQAHITGRRPLNSAFPMLHANTADPLLIGKTRNLVGDMVISDGNDMLCSTERVHESLDVLIPQRMESLFDVGELPHARCHEVEDIVAVVHEINYDPWPPKWLESAAMDSADGMEELLACDLKEQAHERAECHGIWANYWQARTICRAQALDERRRRAQFVPKSAIQDSVDDENSCTKGNDGDDMVPHYDQNLEVDIPDFDSTLLSSVKGLVTEFEWRVTDTTRFVQCLIYALNERIPRHHIIESLKGFTLRQSDIIPMMTKLITILENSSIDVHVETWKTGVEDVDAEATNAASPRVDQGRPASESTPGAGHSNLEMDSEMSRPEENQDREFIFQVMQEAMIEMTDPLFKTLEELALEAADSLTYRKRYASQIREICQRPSLEILDIMNDFILSTKTAFYPPQDDPPTWRASSSRYRDFLSDYENGLKTAATTLPCPQCRVGLLPITRGHCSCGKASVAETRRAIADADQKEESCAQCNQIGSTFLPTEYCPSCGKPGSARAQKDAICFPILDKWVGSSFDIGPAVNSSSTNTADPPIPTTRDQTLPQYRPNSIHDIPASSPLSSKPDLKTAQQDLRGSDLQSEPRNKHDPVSELMSNTEDTAARTSKPAITREGRKAEYTPTRVDLKYWAALAIFEATDEKRGKPGLLSEEDFVDIMLGCRGPGLAFLDEWLNVIAN